MIISIFTLLQIFSVYAADGEYSVEQFKAECLIDETHCKSSKKCWTDRQRTNASLDSEKVCDCEVKNIDKVADKRKLNAMIEFRRSQSSEAKKYLDGTLRGAKVDLGRMISKYANEVAPKCEKDPSYEVPANDKTLMDINDVVVEKPRNVGNIPAAAAEEAPPAASSSEPTVDP